MYPTPSKGSQAVLEKLHEKGTRLMQLRAKLNARTGPDGKPVAGYEKNCDDLRAEIARLEKCNSTATEGVSAIAGTSSGERE